jgi:hypothetical protein
MRGANHKCVLIRRIGLSFLVASVLIVVLFRGYVYVRYHTKPIMMVDVQEFTPEEYPDNPARLSRHHGEYSHARLVIKKNKGADFTFTFLPSNSKSATIVFNDVDVGLMTPSVPLWVKHDKQLTRIALTDRQWNRQQVSFKRGDSQLDIAGGDDVEKKQVVYAELAKNCLNAGLWEILLYSQENNKKTLLYQGWFTFPLGFYQSVFKHNTGLSYWKHAYYLEHWVDPELTRVDLDALRRVTQVYPVVLTQDLDESIAVDGEQVHKKKNMMSNNRIKFFRDYMTEDVWFSTFLPPGLYRKDTPWENEYWRISYPVSAVIQTISSPATPGKSLQELVITYADDKPNKNNDSYFYVSGFDLNTLPRLEASHYAQGKLFLMGIGTPPLKQSYAELKAKPPEKTPEFSVFLNEKDAWINHHEVAIDGAILFIDKHQSNRLHMYLVSYERHAVVAHYMMTLPDELRQKPKKS